MILITEQWQKKLIDYFEEISKVPRCSGHEEVISQYLYDFAFKKGWDVERDSVDNIIIRKPGTVRFEDKPTIILQGHMDMVCEKADDLQYDFLKDGIKPIISGEWMHSQGTTLGADNGVAIAYCLAILDSDDILHPPLEIVFTVGEETTMRGAYGLELDKLKGKMLINLDSEDEGLITVSCAGTTHVKYEIPIEYKYSKSKNLFKLEVSGLKGGHSGVDIDKGRGNANKIMGKILEDVFNITDSELISINGGTKENVIPNCATAEIAIDDIENLKIVIDKWQDILNKEFKLTDDCIKLSLQKQTKSFDKVFNENGVKNTINAINLTPDGPISTREDNNMLIASNNLGIVETVDNNVVIINNVRSSDEGISKDIVDNMDKIALSLKINSISNRTSHIWNYVEKSILRELAIKAYKDISGKEGQAISIHAGVECGYFAGKIKGLDAISLGPSMQNVHTVDERLNIPSFFNCYQHLIAIIESI